MNYLSFNSKYEIMTGQSELLEKESVRKTYE